MKVIKKYLNKNVKDKYDFKIITTVNLWIWCKISFS